MDDPFEQFGAWYKDASDSNVAEPSAFALATATPQGQPSSRMVLLKGFNSHGFVFFTNYGSIKAQEISNNPAVAMTFWWKEVHRQVCIGGEAMLLPKEESEIYFKQRPRGSQIGAWASDQSRPLTDRQALEERFAASEKEFHGKEIPLPSFWGGYRIVPNLFEFWQGQADRLHDRISYTLQDDDSWSRQRLSP